VFALGFPGGSDGKESACNAGDQGLIPGLRRFPGELNAHTHTRGFNQCQYTVFFFFYFTIVLQDVFIKEDR